MAYSSPIVAFEHAGSETVARIPDGNVQQLYSEMHPNGWGNYRQSFLPPI